MKATILTSFVALILAPVVHAQGCLGDVAADGRIDGGDLGVMLANWGPVTSTALSHACDLDGNEIVNGADLGLLLSNWGTCPAPIWATVLEAQPDPAVVTDPSLRSAIRGTGLPWRVRDNGTGVEMLLVPGGTFLMGCIMGADAWACEWPEFPVHQVNLTNAFYIGRYEVTQAQWTVKMGSNPSANQGAANSGICPVEQVSWNDIQGYLNATGLRLPTEAEWEYACRAGTPTPFYNGLTDQNTVGALGWCYYNSPNRTQPGGGKAPNGFGLYDMLGNVWEWVNDRFDTYPSAEQTNPGGPVNGSYRIARGGCVTGASDLRASHRTYVLPDHIWYGGGFRVARNP